VLQFLHLRARFSEFNAVRQSSITTKSTSASFLDIFELSVAHTPIGNITSVLSTNDNFGGAHNDVKARSLS